MNNPNNKYSKWVFTLLDSGDGLPSPTSITEGLETLSDKFIFQLEECPTTLRKHYQGCFVTRIRKRQQTVLVELGVQFSCELRFLTINRMQGTWEQSQEYCSKEESRVGTEVHRSAELQSEELQKYTGKDIEIFRQKGFYPWQEKVNEIIFEPNTFTIQDSSSREVFWIYDQTGNTGKSLFTKYLCYNNNTITKLAFGSGSQMRSAVVEEGPKKCYIIDIPRQLYNDDFQKNIYSVIEDLKNGFVKSSMYGKSKTLFMEPPIVIIFSNFSCPDNKLSVDRWQKKYIIDNELVVLEDERLM